MWGGLRAAHPSATLPLAGKMENPFVQAGVPQVQITLFHLFALPRVGEGTLRPPSWPLQVLSQALALVPFYKTSWTRPLPFGIAKFLEATSLLSGRN